MTKKIMVKEVVLKVKEDIISLLDSDDGLADNNKVQSIVESLIQSLKKLKTSTSTITTTRRSNLNKDDKDLNTDDEYESDTNSHEFIRTNINEYHRKSTLSVREALGHLPSATTTQIAPTLLHLLSDRVEIADVLPATQDVAANEEAMGITAGGKAAVTLTKLGFASAQLYAELIGMPGAWGAGLIDMGTLSSLSAMLRRWCLECRGREPKLSSGKNKSNRSEPPTKRQRKATFNDNESDYDDESDEEVGPTKKEQIIFDADCSNKKNSSLLSPGELIMGGLRVAAALGHVPNQTDFMSWTTEAREAVIDAIVTCLATISSLLTKCKKATNGNEIIGLGNQSLVSLHDGLQRCFNIQSIDDETEISAATEPNDIQISKDRKERANKQHETVIFILRALFPYMSMTTDVPNGQSGKEAAYDAATSALEGFIKSVRAASADRFEPERQALMELSSKTPATTPKSIRKNKDFIEKKTPTGTATPKTGRKDTGRKKRVSFGGDVDKDTVPVPPTLKKSCTPKRSRSLTPSQEFKPHPILSTVLGLLQKLATSKTLGKANDRARTVSTIMKCLPCFPSREQLYFLRFIIQLCQSKVSVHRLLGSELTGSVLAEQWLWKNHARRLSSSQVPQMQDLSDSSSKTPTSNATSLSPVLKASMDNMPFALFGALNGRLKDKVPAVRARAAFSLAEMLQNFSSGDLSFDDGNDPWIAFEEIITTAAGDLIKCLRKRAVNDERSTVKRGAIVALIELLVLGETAIFHGNNQLYISETDVSILSSLCADNSVAIRKVAAESISHLLKKCYFPGHCSIEAAYMLEQAFSRSVLPHVLDAETTCASKALDLFTSLAIEPVIEMGGRDLELDDSQKRRYLSAWRILAHASETSRQKGAARGETESLRNALKKLFANGGSAERDMAKAVLKETRSVCLNTLENTDDESSLFHDDVETKRIGVWCLLDAFVESQSQPKERQFLAQCIKRSSIDVKFLASSWASLLQLSLSATTPKHYVAALCGATRSCLRVLTKLAWIVPQEDAELASDELKHMLSTFVLSPDIIGSALSALVSLTHRTSGLSETKAECSKWIQKFYTTCTDTITSYVSKAKTSDLGPNNDQETLLVRSLFTVGELSMIGFRSDEDTPSVTSSNVVATAEDPVAGLYERPTKLLLDLVQSMLGKALPGAGLEQHQNPEPVRAHAFVALGKLCVRDESLAKNCLAILARELHQSVTDMSPAVQSNALLVLGDLCVKYTNLADRYLPVMAACLQSGNTLCSTTDLANTHTEDAALVRKHAVLMLSSLLLQDYIKFRGLLFHRFLVASVDEDDGVAKLAEMTLCGPLLTKHPKLLFNNFVESLFVLNKCTAHPIYAAAASIGENGAGVAVGFDGIEAGKELRMQMYNMMLGKMTDEEKIGVTARLAKDVLGAAVNSDGDLGRVCRKPPTSFTPLGQKRGVVSTPNKYRDESAFNVLSDAFTILTSPSLRVGKASSNNGGDDDDIEDSSDLNKSKQLAVVAKGRLLSNISRKHLIEIVLPIVCNLKTILQDSRSPLLKDLMRYMVEIFRGYRTEVREFLANDPTLLQEIEYDSRQFKKSQNMETPISKRERVLIVKN